MNKKHIGHDSQIRGVEEHILVGGKGSGMRLLQVRNGIGLELTISADRCADISRLSFKGVNMGYFAPCGYVAPSYYNESSGFLKSFTAGFLTTCGLENVGAPCEENGEKLPLHGSVSSIPAEHIYWTQNETEISVFARMVDECLFSRKLVLEREIKCPLNENSIIITDKITNHGDTDYPCEILYHFNMGYPLLSENAELYIPSQSVKARNAHAQKSIGTWNRILPPTINFIEQCYYHSFKDKGVAAIYNSDINSGVSLEFDAAKLPFFTQWKMCGERDYVLGLEPGNCHPDGRAKMREDGKLKILRPAESVTYSVKVNMLNESNFTKIQNQKEI